MSKAKKKIDAIRRSGNTAAGPNPFAETSNQAFFNYPTGVAPPQQQQHSTDIHPPSQQPYPTGFAGPHHPAHPANHGKVHPQQNIGHVGNAAPYGRGQSPAQGQCYGHQGGWGGPAAPGVGPGAGAGDRVGLGFAATPYAQTGGTRPPQSTTAARMTKSAEKVAGKLVQKGKEKRDKRQWDKNMKRLDYNSD